MLKKNKKREINVSLIVVFLFLIIGILVFIYVNNLENTDKKHWISTNFKDSNIITITSTLPVSDELGRNLDGKGTKEGIQGYIEFSIKNNTKKPVEYEVLVNKKDIVKEIKGNYIKFYVTDEVDNPVSGFEKNSVPTYNDLLSLIDLPGSRLLTSGRLAGEENKKLVLRSWLSDSYVVSNDEKEFSFDINVRAK